ncbi:MAG: alpha/beta fold hydrolase [Pseudomonadota bacterium]
MPEPLVLLPGMMCDWRLWRHQIDALSLGGERAVSVGDITRGCSVPALAEHVLAEAPERFALAGLSMGGIVALEIWRQQPERVSRLALLDTNHLADPSERQALRNDQIARVLNGELMPILREELKPNYLASVHRGNTGLLDEVMAMGVELGATVFERQSIALRDRPDSGLTLGTINRPTLVLCGDEDQLCPPERHRAMAALLPDPELVVIQQCGHLATLEQPAAVTQALSNWLQR